MQVKLHKPEKNSLECKLDVTFAAQEFEKKIQKKLVELSKTVKMPGFRPGKIPLDMVQSKYGQEVKWEIIQDEAQEAYRQALIQENITPASIGSFENMNFEDIEKLSFTAIVEQMPEVKVAKLEKLKLNRYLPLIKDEDVEEQLKVYQNYHRTWEEKIVGSQAEEGDNVVIDFVGHLEDGSTFDGNSANDFSVILGDKKMLPEFEQALYGCTEGEQKKVTFTFPKGYGEETLSEKNATFSITVKSISRPSLPALDDAEFLKKMGIEGKDAEQLKSLARMESSLQVEQSLNSFNNKVLQDALLAAHDFIVPKTHIEEEEKTMLKETEERFKQREPNAKPPPLSADEQKKMAEIAHERCKLSLIYKEMADTYEIKPDAESIARNLQQLCQQYFNGDFDAFKKSPQLPQVKRELGQRSILEQINHTVYEKATVTEVQKHKDDLKELSKKIFSAE